MKAFPFQDLVHSNSLQWQNKGLQHKMGLIWPKDNEPLKNEYLNNMLSEVGLKSYLVMDMGLAAVFNFLLGCFLYRSLFYHFFFGSCSKLFILTNPKTSKSSQTGFWSVWRTTTIAFFSSSESRCHLLDTMVSVQDTEKSFLKEGQKKCVLVCVLKNRNLNISLNPIFKYM